MHKCAFPLAGMAIIFALATGCGSRAPGTTGNTNSGDADTGGGEQELGDLAVETFATPLQVAAGDLVTAACVVSRDREYLSGIATNVIVSPEAGSLVPEDSTVTFTPTEVGDYTVRCETTDGLTVDGKGVTIEVVAGPPAVIETEISDNVTEAGAPVQVDCTVFDEFMNFIPEEDYDGPVDLALPPELNLDPPSGPGFTVRGTLAGDYEVGCIYGEIIDDAPEFADATPEPLTVVPGIPGYTETIVTPSYLAPTDVATIECIVQDDFGNPLPDVETNVIVMVADGTMAADAGLTYDDTQMSATLAETYYVACKVPEYFAGDETPAVVEVHPGLPHHWIVELPDQDCFWQDRGLPLLYIVYDQWGNEVSDDDFDVVVWSSPAGVTFQDDVVTVPLEGDFTIWVDLAGSTAQAPNSTIAPVGSAVRVDSTPPVIDITSPSRATALQQSATPVNITGDVTDGVSAIETLEINGNVLAVAPGSTYESISQNQNSQWGLNIITGSSMDECGNRRVIAQSYLRSGQYFNAATWSTSSARASSGITARLNQNVLDDTNRSDADDLATIAWMILSGMDLDAVIPGTIADDRSNVCHDCFLWTDCATQGYLVQKTGAFTYSQPTIDWLYAVDGGLFLGLSISNLDLPLRVEGWFNCSCCGDYNASASGDVEANYVWVDTTLSVSLSGTNPNVSICPSCLDIGFNGLWIDIDWGILDFLDFLLNEIVNAIIGLFQGQIETLLEDQMRAMIPPLIEDFLSGFELEAGFDIPAPLDMHINLASGLDYIDFDGPQGSGNGELGLYTQVYPDSRDPAIPASAPGTIRRRDAASDGPGPGVSFSSFQYDFGLALEDDVLNQLLWGLWYGGGLELDLSEILGLAGGGIDLTGVTLTISGELPPVIMPGSGGNQIYIGLGDAYVDATVDLAALLGNPDSTAPPLHVGMYLSTIIGGFIDLDPSVNELLVALDPNPQVWVEVVQIDDEGYQGTMTDLFSGLMQVLLPPLFEQVLGSFPVPSFDLGGLAGLPAGTVLELTNGSLGRPNTSNWCLGGTEKMDATHFCLTGSLQ